MSLTFWPASHLSMALTTSLAERTRVSLTSAMMSLTSSPAFSAGALGSTVMTCAPAGGKRRMGSSGPSKDTTVTPMRGRTTLPLSISWSM